MLYSMCAHVSAICTNDFFQQHASQSLQEEGSVLYFSSYPSTTYSTKPDPSTSSKYSQSDWIFGLKHHERLCKTFSLFDLYLQDPKIAQVALDFIPTKLFQCELDWWGQQHLWLMQKQGVLPGERASWTPQWIKPDLPFPSGRFPIPVLT